MKEKHGNLAEHKVCFIVSSPGTACAFLKSHIKALSKEYRIYLVASFKTSPEIAIDGVAHYEDITIERKISIVRDIKAFFRLVRFFRKEKFDVTHSVTPKAGFITSFAAWVSRVPCRVHIFTGQVWANKTGMVKRFLRFADKLIFVFDNRFLADSYGQREFLIKEQMVKPHDIRVLGPGSICGVDIKRFTPSQEIRTRSRKQLGIGDNEIVYVFMGRLTKDKGINELLDAYHIVVAKYSNTRLLLIGENEGCYSLDMLSKNNVLYTGHTDRPQDLLQAGDIFCLPSYREGFGNCVVEASALGLPVICSDIYGLKDSMVTNVTGLRCIPGDVSSLASSMIILYENDSLRHVLGRNGRQRVSEMFPSNIVTASWVRYYNNELFRSIPVV